MEWWKILLIVAAAAIVWAVCSIVFYRKFFKRFYDIVLSALALTVLSPLLLLLTIITAVNMGSNPFFVQQRPGKNEKIFKLIKLRTMTNKKDEDGNLLPDEERLTKYGKFLRATSLDELFSLINIFKGDISIVGPRPLLVKYLPLYSPEQARRHDVRPGLTGLAQVNGRNALTWEKKFEYDITYVDEYNFFMDIAILFKTVGKVFMREGISEVGHATMEEFKGNCVIEADAASSVDNADTEESQ